MLGQPIVTDNSTKNKILASLQLSLSNSAFNNLMDITLDKEEEEECKKSSLLWNMSGIVSLSA
jgi:hypothetical protein